MRNKIEINNKKKISVQFITMLVEIHKKFFKNKINVKQIMRKKEFRLKNLK